VQSCSIKTARSWISIARGGPAVQSVLKDLVRGSQARYRKLIAASGLVDEACFLPGSPVIDQPTTVFAASWAIILGRPADPTFFAEIDRELRQATMAHLTAIGDPKTVLAKLAGQGQLGLITNDAEGTARAHSRMLGLNHVLEFVAGYDFGLGAKPERGPVIAFAAAVGVSTNEIVVVGDSALDVATARNAGARAVAVLTGPQSSACLAGAEPDAVVASIMELSAWLEIARVIAG
jgi:phosphoglycolate phosphatase